MDMRKGGKRNGAPRASPSEKGKKGKGGGTFHLFTKGGGGGRSSCWRGGEERGNVNLKGGEKGKGRSMCREKRKGENG